MHTGDFSTDFAAALRDVAEQRNISRQSVSAGKDVAYEISAAESYARRFGKIDLDLNLQLTLFHSRGFTKLYPEPRVSVRWKPADMVGVTLQSVRSLQFTHLVKESQTGLPCNYWINAGADFLPQYSRTVRADVSFNIAPLHLNIEAGGYYRRLSGVTEYGGTLFSFINSDYNPLRDLYSGKGDSYGLSIFAYFSIDKVDAWAGYTLSRSELRIPELSARAFPASFDRRHDFKCSAVYRPSSKWSFSISAVYASGTPYTEAAYGYMIGENLIFKFFPHNSSRQPDYWRLDIGATWNFMQCGRLSHSLSLSVYNATWHHNVVMMSYTYDPDDGFVLKKSAMKYAIPSLTYTLEFE